MEKITVLGATGKVGSQLIKFLSAAGIPCNAVTRDLSKVTAIPLVNWIAGDLNNREGLRTLLAGTNKLFLNTGVTEDMFDVQKNIIDTVVETGAVQIVKLSTPSASPASKDRIGQMHWQIEEYLKKAGVIWNSLQPQTFMQNWLGDLANNVRKERKIYTMAGDGRKAFTDTRDIAEVAYSLLMDPKEHRDKIVALSGPALVNYDEVAIALTAAIGETVTHVSQTPEEGKERMLKAGFSEWAIQINTLVETNQQLGAGEKLISYNVAAMLEKPGRNIYDFAKDYASSFK